MNHLNSTPIRRLGAWVMCLLLVTVQLVMPLVALAAADLAGLPMVFLNYSVAEDDHRTLSVGPSLNGESPVFWATLPQDAFQFSIIVEEIVPPMGGVYAYTPEPGTPISTGDATDFMSASTTIYVYQDGEPIDSYPLYVSSAPAPMPETEPEPQAVTVSVPVLYQVKDEGTLLHSEEATCTYNMDNIISVNMDILPAEYSEYSLVSESSVYVTVDEMGNANPSTVIFYFSAPPVQQPEPKNGIVFVHYTDMGGMEIAETETRSLTPGTHNVAYGFIPEGYIPNAEWPASFEVKVDEQGGTDPEHVYFEFKQEQVKTDPPAGEETDPPAAEKTDPPAGEETDPPAGEETDPPAGEETDPPSGEPSALTEVGRYAMTSVVVNFRTEPSKSSKIAFSKVGSNTYVWVIGTVTVNGEVWAKINYNGTESYVAFDLGDSKEYIRILTQQDSDAYNYAQSSPVPGTETQPPQGPSSVNVTVSYVDANNPANVLGTQTVSCAANTDTEIVANLSGLAGYTVVGDDRVTVSVSENGTASPETVAFMVQKVLAKGTITIRHITADNQDIISPQTVEKTEGTYDVTPNTAAVPQGYVLKSAGSVSVTIDASGNVTPNTVSFTYEKPVITGTVDVLYTDTMNATIANTEKRTLTLGDNAISPNVSVIPQGYTLKAGNPESVNVVLRADGTVDPQAVTFVYEKAAPVPQKVTVSVNYVDGIGQTLAAQTVEFDKAGTYTIAADAVPAGYVLSDNTPKSVPVTVDDKLVAAPASVSFKCEKPAQPAKVAVNYVYKADNTILATETLELAPGTKQNVVPNAQRVPTGYSLAEGSTLYVEVSVSTQGVATPNAVTFYYKKTEADQYEGYGLTTERVALRSEGSMSDSAIITTLEKNTLLYLKRQFDSSSVRWSEAQLVLGKNLGSGFVQDDKIRHITPAEAQALIEKYNQANATPTPAPWVAPAQVTGYYITIMNSVPVRKTADSYAEVHSWLPYDTVVYVSGQLFPNQQTWHISTYDNYTGYIRADQLRKMTAAEVQTYQQSQTNPINTNATPPTPDPNAKSSYGYVTSNNVNFRQSPNGAKIKTLNKYALTMIYGSQIVNGKTWYNVNQGGTLGWISGDFLKVMTLTEFNSFINSNEYYQGLANSTSGTSSGTSGSTSSGTSSSTGTASAGTISSVEDWNVGAWQNSGSGTGLNASYEPFDPYATPAASDLPEASAIVEPTSTFVIGTMIPIDYEDESKETQTGSSPWGLIAAGVVLVGGAGGVYVYALNQNNKRKAAARAAAANRRNGQPIAGSAAAGNKQQGAQSPYARRAVAAPPAAGAAGAVGAKQTQGGQGAQAPNTRPTATGAASQPNPFAATGTASNTQGIFTAPMGSTQQSAQSPYARPVNQSGEPTSKSTAAQQASSTAAPQPSKNPYVQPLGNAGAGNAGTGNEATPETARRAGRTKRYQSTEGDDGKA